MSGLTLRPAVKADVERAGDVAFVAFYHVALSHGLVPAITSPLDTRHYLSHLLGLDPLGGVVAEENGEIVGVGWVHKRGPVATIGPLAVHPRTQGRGVGRRLLERCLETAGQGAPQVRLVQESHNTASLGLYLHAGFRVVAPLLELELPPGVPLVAAGPVAVRAARPEDRARLVARDARAFGAERPQSIDFYLGRGRGLIAERGGTPVGYALGIGLQGVAYLGSASADDGEVLLQLLATLALEVGGGELTIRTQVPATDRRLVSGLVQLGFRVFRAAQYMVRGGGTPPPPNYVLMNGDMM
jgi:GNAT superfamily N-acetyltransferase